jgi:hypothetical protein
MAATDLKLKVSIKEKNDRGQEVELVCKTIQFKPQVSQNSILSQIFKKEKFFVTAWTGLFSAAIL